MTDSSAAPRTARRLRLGWVVGATFDTYGADPLLFLALALPPAALGAVLVALPAVGDTLTVVLVSLVGLAVTLVATVATVVAVDELWRGREPAGEHLFRLGLGRSPAVALVSILAVLAVVVPVALVGLLVAGLPLAVRALLALVMLIAAVVVVLRLTPIGPIVVLEGVGGLAAMRRAWELTRGSAWRLLGLLGVIVVLTLPASYGAQVVADLSPLPAMRGLASLLATVVTTPVVIISTTLAWADLADRGYGPNDRLRPGPRRLVAVGLVLGFGMLLAAIGLSQAG